MTNQKTTAEHWRLQLIAAACALQHATCTAANIIPIPGTDRFIAIGTALDVARLLEIAPAGGSIDVLDTIDAITGKDIAGIACFETERFYLAGDVDGLVIRAARQIGQQAQQLEAQAQPAAAPGLEYRTCCDHPGCTTCAGRGGHYRMTASTATEHDHSEGRHHD